MSLSARNLDVVIKNRWLLRDVSLDLAGGRVTAIIGPNGAGKSTLLRVLAGETRPTRGTVTLDGDNIAAVAPWRLACRRAVMPQTTDVSLPFTGAEVVGLGLETVGRAATRVARTGVIRAALAAADAGPLADRIYQTLSGGEKTRIQFARVLAQLEAGRAVEPRQILFLDEPTAALDLRHQIGLMRAARSEAARGTAVFAILHDINLACGFADELVVLQTGAIVAHGAPATALTNALLRDVFDVDLRLGEVPQDLPFVLPCRAPQAATMEVS